MKRKIMVIMYPYTAERRDVFGCTSPTTKRFPEAREMSRGRSPRDISRAEGNLEVGGDVQPNKSRLEAVYGHSLIINPSLGMYQKLHPYRTMNMTVLKSILPCLWGSPREFLRPSRFPSDFAIREIFWSSCNHDTIFGFPSHFNLMDRFLFKLESGSGSDGIPVPDPTRSFFQDPTHPVPKF